MVSEIDYLLSVDNDFYLLWNLPELARGLSLASGEIASFLACHRGAVYIYPLDSIELSNGNSMTMFCNCLIELGKLKRINLKSPLSNVVVIKN